MAENETPDAITIKKYANRRLYNTATSKYVTLDDLSGMVKSGVDFVVVDAKSGADITRSVLTQIIFEEEGKGQNLLPIKFLRQLIGFYGDSLQSVVPNYLEYSMNAFAQNEENMRSHMKETMGGMFPFGQWEELGKQNMAMFERAMQMFTPPDANGASGQSAENDSAPSGPQASDEDSDGDDMSALKAQLKALQEQVDNLSRAKRTPDQNDRS
ncbi:MAG: polyhydroxyalkanoate synthesis repressor PhaR [Alphaproteobacteria bacterium]|nr:polyhydroxyalkanoate synthesis repressor PhaR [Alphaproteobacteria bacterium]MCZ6511419.1 polyhydroxyalkanoate synthesis repressor PhaR [Alphaproteobacteria bacterium]MCZ6589386.1 polyhydroxyalkanoate synthesis repressor PhaR [Alphaproteobacteria bacterium]MCZ6592458.1 polyhydroxyalkanoate synthesis repressor PhaR [Alphaproteobacteria bacterium]